MPTTKRLSPRSVTFTPALRAMSDAVEELQTLHDTLEGASETTSQALVAGTTSRTDITVTGIRAGDRIVGVIDLGTPRDMTSEASVTRDDTIQLDTTDTSGRSLLVTWATPAV